MGIFNDFFKKEKPVFTGSRFGFGSGGGGGASESPPVVEVLFSNYTTSYTSATDRDSSPTKVLSPSIQYLYVLGVGGGGASGNTVDTGDDGAGGGGGGAGLTRLTGYQIPAANIGSPIYVEVGRGGYTDHSGTSTRLRLNGNVVLDLGGGNGGADGNGPRNGGAGGTFASPGLTRLPSFPSLNEKDGGDGGKGGKREGSGNEPGQPGSPSVTGGGGGGGAHLNNRNGGNGGYSNVTSPNPQAGVIGTQTYNIVQQNFAGSFPNPFPISLTGQNGANQRGPNGYGSANRNTTDNDNGLTLGGGGYGADNNTGAGAGAGGGHVINTPNDPGDNGFGGGGGGMRAYSTTPGADPIAKGWGGPGYIIVVGSSFELVSGVDY